jgi:uncharacterized membrane protein
MVVHFPIALLTVGVAADVLGAIGRFERVREFALWILVIGVVTLIAAYLTGQWAEEPIENISGFHEHLESHEDLAAVAVWTWMGLLALRGFLQRKTWQGTGLFGVYLVLSVAGCVLIGAAAHQGGQLVYEHGAGVKNIASVPPPSPHVHSDD